MIEHVRRRAMLNSFGVPVVVATGDYQIKNLIESFGGRVVTTERVHENGMSRVGESHETLNWERYIILQGDEVLVDPLELDALIKINLQNDAPDSCNVITRIKSFDHLEDSSIVKCVLGTDEKIKYLFRRSPLTVSNERQLEHIFKICGLFSLTSNLLKALLTHSQTALAELESIEQLKIIELGFDLVPYLSNSDFPSVNLAKDLDEVEILLSEDKMQKSILKIILTNE
jgi:3-deoxy-manno-octulosonate cytidylyltransferase (CMP-KDO synthetase)